MKYLIPLLVLSFAASSAFGKAAYCGKKEMIQRAEAIVIVNISKVEKTRAKRTGWTYSERAHATVERSLKGSLDGKVLLHGGEDFICAQVRYKPGRNLVFLRRDGDLWSGVNWHLGVREIKGGRLDWFADDKSLEVKPARLADVVAEISSALKNKRNSKGRDGK